MTGFRAFSHRKAQEAASAALPRLVTIEDRAPAFGWIAIGNEWTRDRYDGPFYLSANGPADVPLVSLVFVQSRDGNTVAANPEDLGGGPADKHLIYEGLSRVAAHAVLAGARTAEGEDVFFSVWHPQLVSLRATLGLPRHPAQVIVAGGGRLDLERSLIFNAPGVPAFVLASPDGCARLEGAASRRRSVELVPIRDGDLRPALQYLRGAHGIGRISAVGGRTTASDLIDAGLVLDICLTTTGRSAGEPGTPFYAGRSPPILDAVSRKRGTDPDYPIVVEQLAVRRVNAGC